jgi:hypothetical protein
MTPTDLQDLCEQGQSLLMETRYWDAERALARAEKIAWESRDWDTLARLYMPLQEARRQRRQRCGEGVVALDLISTGPGDNVDPHHVVTNFPHGQFLVAGWGTIQPAVDLRKLAEERGLYIETFLAATYPVQAGRAVVIVPTADVAVPAAEHDWSIDSLMGQLPAHCIVLNETQIPQGSRKGTTQTYAEVMALWERLAAPFLAAADNATDPIVKAVGYRQTIRVDYACELAHQRLSNVAAEMDARQRRKPA